MKPSGNIGNREISSSNSVFVAEKPIVIPLELVPNTSTQTPTFVYVPHPNRNLMSNIIFIEQTDYFRNLAKYICRLAPRRNIEYSASTEEDWVLVTVCHITLKFTLDYEAGCTTLKCSHLKHTIGFPNMHYVFCASMLFDYILKTYAFRLMLLKVSTDSLEIGFPTQNLSIEIFCFDCSKDNIEEVLSRWMPHIDKVEQMNIGNVRSVEQHRKCLKIFRTYFEGKTESWAGETMPLSLINELRRMIPSTSLQRTSVPIAHVFRWIKGWIIGLQGYKHITQVYYNNPAFRMNKGVFRVFLKIMDDVENSELILKNFDGKRAKLYVTSYGGLNFQVITKNFEGHVNCDPSRLPFSTENLADDVSKELHYLGLDYAEGQNFRDYATPRNQGNN